MPARVLYLFFTNLLLLNAFGQNRPLDKTVNIRFQQSSFPQALNTISDLGGLDYAFNPSFVSKNFRFNAEFKDARLEEVLQELCEEAHLRFSVNEGILFFKPEKTPKQQPAQIRIEGKIQAKQPDNRAVKIEEPTLSLETYTDTAGRYVLILPVPEYTLDLSIKLDGFEEKKVSIRAADKTQFHVALSKDSITEIPTIKPQEQLSSKGVDTVFIPEITDYFPASHLVLKKYKEAAKADSVVENGDVNFQLMGGVGFPHSPTSRYKNKFSFNLSSYSAGLEGLEIGGLNINRFDVEGVQIALLGNANGGKTSGIQIGTLFNQSKLKFKGIQIALLYNESSRLHEGVQLSSFLNSSRGRVKGLQLALAGNYSQNATEGLQTSVLVNWSEEEIKGLQLGSVNYSKKVQGTQIGFVNISDTVSGTQIGFVNRAKKAKGVQVGFVNVRDTLVENTVSFGLLNWVKGGFKGLELGWENDNLLQLNFKSGGRVGYGIIAPGLTFQDDKAFFALKLGYGLKAKIKNRNHLLQELTWSHDFTNLENDRYAYSTLWMHQWGKSGFYTVLGPQLNLWKGESLVTDLPVWSQNDYSNGKSLILYPGFQVGAGVRL